VDDIPAQRQRQPVILRFPPGAEILAKQKPLLLPGQLTFVNDQPSLRPAGMDRLKNPVKRNDNKIDFRGRQLQPELERQKRAGHRPRHGDFRFGQFRPSELFFGDDHWPVAIAHAGPARQQGIFVTDKRISMNADRRNIQFAAGGPLVESLDVLQNMFELEATGWNEILGQSVKHKSVIRIRRMPQR
jgi:hypothetical protein